MPPEIDLTDEEQAMLASHIATRYGVPEIQVEDGEGTQKYRFSVKTPATNGSPPDAVITLNAETAQAWLDRAVWIDRMTW